MNGRRLTAGSPLLIMLEQLPPICGRRAGWPSYRPTVADVAHAQTAGSRQSRAGVTSEALPTFPCTHPCLGHRHAVGLPAFAGIHVVDHDAAQYRSPADDDHLRIVQALLVPLVRAGGVCAQVPLTVEDLAVM